MKTLAIDTSNSNIIIGKSDLFFPHDITIHQIDTGLTAVRKNYQGKGIATIMKIKGIQALQRIKNINEDFYIDTANADTNDQMLHINTKLGFPEIYDLSSYEGLIKDLDV